MNIKSIILLCLSIVGNIGAYAQLLTQTEARSQAVAFFGNQHKEALNCVLTEKKNGSPVYYVFSSETTFAVVSADKRAPAILAYSYNHGFDGQTLAPAAAMWLDYYQQAIASLQGQSVKQAKATQTIVKEVLPLTTSRWGQEKNYNYFCPADDDGPSKRCVTGCVATALAQLMYYFRFPQSGEGSYGYVQEPYGELKADFEHTYYDYDAMSDKSTGINAAAARLIKDAGVACDLVYGPKGSGMYNHKAAYALRTYFKYSPNTEYVFRDSTNMDWDSLIVSHLDRQIPLYYAGWSVPNVVGHGFICDGYQLNDIGDYYYHFNFGWDGNSDGYFYTGQLSPSGNDFNLAQEIIVNAYPDTAKCTYPVQASLIGTDTLKGVEGSTNYFMGRDIPQGVNYTWYIIPDVDTITKMDISLSVELAEGDSLFIMSPNIVGSFHYTDTVLNLRLTRADISELIVKLVTHSANSRSLHFSYNSHLPIFCTNIKFYTAQKGTVEDGSGKYNYADFTYCRHKITVSSKTGLIVYFPEFKTQEGDTLFIYNPQKTPSELLLALTGDYSGRSFTFNTNSIMLSFITDEAGTDAGWTMEYEGGYADVNEQEWQEQAGVVPNPVQNEFELTLSEVLWLQLQNHPIQLYDVSGKLLKNILLENNVITIDMSTYAPGMYFLKIGAITKKILKK